LFTRFEAEINAAFDRLVTARNVGVWADFRVWEELRLLANQDRLPLTSKASLLTARGGRDWTEFNDWYDLRNDIAHGGIWQRPLVIPVVAQQMHDIVNRFTML
jgi:hypothetical protein